LSADYDVIVVGGGGAGLVAAYTAAECGARTLLVEADTKVGGSTRLSGGVVYAAGTSVQKQAGISDDPEAMFRYYMALNQYRLNPGVIRNLCHSSGPLVEWLIKMGVEFPVERLYMAGLDGVARGHRAAGRGEAIVSILDARLSGHSNVTIALASRIDGLIDNDHRIRGVVVSGETVTAGAVVLCTGGFGANYELIARYLPETAKYGDWLWYVGSNYCRGDGINMGLRVGAVVTGHDCVTPLLTPGFGKDFEPYIPGWFLYVDRDGLRFVDESIDYSVSGSLVRDLPGGECFAIFDENARSGKEVKLSKGGEVMVSPSWSPDRLAEMIDKGKIIKAQTIEALAESVGINHERLETTIRDYNADCVEGIDRSFLKSSDLMRPVVEPPFYAVRIRPAVVGITGCGLRTKPDASVVGVSGSPINGLYAAGETVGGILGSCYVGGGGSLLNALSYGRVAGASAARHAAKP